MLVDLICHVKWSSIAVLYHIKNNFDEVMTQVLKAGNYYC